MAENTTPGKVKYVSKEELIKEFGGSFKEELLNPKKPEYLKKKYSRKEAENLEKVVEVNGVDYFLMERKIPKKWKKLDSSYYLEYISEQNFFVANPRKAIIVQLKT